MVLMAVMALAGCVRSLAAPASESLVGSSSPLLPEASPRLAVAGHVAGRSAEIGFDVTAAMTLVTSGCVDDPPLERGQVRLTDPVKTDDTLYSVTRLRGLRVGAVRLRRCRWGWFKAPDAWWCWGSTCWAIWRCR